MLISSTPASEPPSRLKLCRKVSCARAVWIATARESRYLSDGLPVSVMLAAFGAVSLEGLGLPELDVAQSGPGPVPFVVVQAVGVRKTV